ncbi:MAG: ADP-glyceromanno-heptose 6-epimerase [Victivallales bacterium]|nr:ADP-glyceromanno-heptose 6-epimerase [bacterium]MDD7752364.1 ADP-glyceromanno-heptose 6-epimerase [bacterium]MDY5697508.1 ADP-glyceromanno-heptose 6-epimerase [Victivallales bacterium]
MKYIVTGGAGLIGGAVVAALNEAGEDDILVVDHLGTSEKWKNLRGLQFTDYLEKDIFRRLLYEGKFNDTGIKAVFHLGACSSTTERDASYLADNNFNVTKELAAFSVSNQAHFLYASSAATYGAGEHGYVDDEEKMHELRPLNMYGYSKLMFDLWAKRTGILHSITGMKFTNVFGPNEKHKGPMRSMVLRSFEQITSRGYVELFRSDRPEYADGEQKRDFIYVKDVAQMILALMEHNAKGIYNIGSGRAESWNALATAVFNALGKTPDIRYIDMPDTLKGKYQYFTKADMTKFNALNTGRGAHPLEKTVADYVRNHLLPESREA